ncbi:trypsin-like peptidase domain-containing protein [Streptantibioticus ferralitis]|uniref:Trypsin-like peptidase domain-containing protein n=1 Tax=Streptantibioticus ferralitis TaxID=236510 RepID=A0ABT5Z4R0_9ACTN|nr:trypsin-like peptidase domain-containing protein [Streptantibioticus ferralitis]MDF2258807.1 trypsin-like peptidase domain-containing protein [Streptantibioticus ferralitis]
MLVGTRHVVTCAHVLDKQFGREEPEPGRSPAAPAEIVVVEFPFADKIGSAGTRMRATVVGWVPVAADGSGDAALLELESELDLIPDLEPEPEQKTSVAYTPAPLACPPGPSGHQFSVHGFPHGSPAARQVNGVVRGASGEEGPWVQLDPEGTAGWAIEVGFSGAPVFDKSREAVVGIVVIRDDHRTGHMIPTSYLRGLWPEVRNNCRWRLDLEASYRTHWRPRARGSEPGTRTKEWFFTGRTEARRVIRDWLEGDNPALAEHSMLLVTGGPGSGKSALLAHSLVASDPLLSRTVPTSGPCPPTGAFDAAVYLKGRTCDEMRAQLARALDVTASDSDELVAAVPEFPGGKRFTVLADAVEEAASLDEALDVADLLSQLASTGRVRVLAGVRTTPAGASRQEILTAFGRSTPRIDLEDSRYLHRPDVAEYVARRLASEQANSARYRAYGPDQLRAIGEKVARKARYNFLIAQLTTGWLMDPRGQQSGPDDPDWEAELPETVGQAMDRYLRTCRPDTATVKRLLTALAYARGDGLPRGASWLRMADALASDADDTARDLEKVFTTRDLGKVFNSAAQHLVERVNEGSGPHTYRLFHDALDQHLRETLEREHHAPEAAITAVLTDAVPCGRDAERNWAEADAYTRDHLASHAAAAGQLDSLIIDADYLVHATPRNLIRHLYAPSAGSARRTAAVYRSSVNLHATATPAQRRQILALDATRAGTTCLQQQLARRIPEGNWVPQWATRGDFSPALRDSLTGHTDDVCAVACTTLQGKPVAVTAGDDKTVRLWDLASGVPIGQPLSGLTSRVDGVACSSLDGSPIAVTIGSDRTIRVWDLTSGTPLGQAPTDPYGMMSAVACTNLDGSPVAVTGGSFRGTTVWIWDLASGTPIGRPLADAGPVGAVACTTLGGIPVAVTAGSAERPVRVWDLASGAPIDPHHDIRRYSGLMALACTDLNGRRVAVTANRQSVRVWDLASGAPIGGPLTYHSTEPLEFVVDVACATLGAAPVAVTVHSDGTVRIWDLASGSAIGQPLLGHTDLVHAVACTNVDGNPIAVTAGRDRTVRLWDLTAASTDDEPPAGHTGQVTAAACTSLRGRPVAVTTSRDESVRLWDLTSGAPIGRPLLGHTGPVFAVACTSLDGKPIAVTTGDDKTVRLWDLVSGTPVGQPITGHTSAVYGVACTSLRGRPVAITIGHDTTAWVWDLISRTLIVRLISPVDSHVYTDRAIACTSVNGAPFVVTSGPPAVRVWDLTSNILLSNDSDYMTDSPRVACTVLDGMPVAVTSDGRGTAHIRNLTAGGRIGRPLVGHASRMRIETCADLDGTPVAITTGDREAVQVWDLRTGEAAGQIIANRVDAVALGEEGHLVVGMGRDIAVFTRHPRRSPPGPHPMPDA